MTSSSHSSAPTTGNGVIRRSPLTRTLGGGADLDVEVGRALFDDVAKDGGKVDHQDQYRQVRLSA